MIYFVQSKIVFPLRNPKSVVVSNFYHRRNFKSYEWDGTFAGHLPDFMIQIGRHAMKHKLWFNLLYS